VTFQGLVELLSARMASEFASSCESNDGRGDQMMMIVKLSSLAMFALPEASSDN
jgi:hypothetical protein